MSRFRAWRLRLKFGLPTILGMRPKGYFIPYRYAAGMPAAGTRPPYEAIASLFDRHRPAFREWLDRIDDYREALEQIGDAPAPAPRWTQDWFPRLDAAMAYCMVRSLAPRRIVEIGSGHSTRFYARAIGDGAIESEILAIDPAPRSSLSGLPFVTLDRRTLQDVGTDIFSRLAPGDILSIDSSHILMPGSDVDALFNRVLPVLPAGVVVHIHDIFLPDDYPAAWDWRGYNEQLGIAALLTGGGWHPLFASHYAVTRMKDAVSSGIIARLPLPAGAHESSLWLRKESVTGAPRDDATKLA